MKTFKLKAETLYFIKNISKEFPLSSLSNILKYFSETPLHHLYYFMLCVKGVKCIFERHWLATKSMSCLFQRNCIQSKTFPSQICQSCFTFYKKRSLPHEINDEKIRFSWIWKLFCCQQLQNILFKLFVGHWTWSRPWWSLMTSD